jgi:hypothetical protein
VGYASSGFEVGNAFDLRGYPAARRNRVGPPPSGSVGAPDPFANRGAPIRARSTAFALREDNGRAVAALGPFVGPGLVKRIDATFFLTQNVNPIPHINIFYNTAAYTTATNLAVTTLPAGTRIWESVAAEDQPRVFADEGGLATLGGQTFSGSYLIDYYAPDAQFFLALVARAVAGSNAALYGTLLVYEGVLLSDFPMILG